MTADRARSALEHLIPEIAPPDDAAPLVSTFLRGLAIGALVGAAIAGSAILQRRRSHEPAATTGEADPPKS